MYHPFFLTTLLLSLVTTCGAAFVIKHHGFREAANTCRKISALLRTRKVHPDSKFSFTTSKLGEKLASARDRDDLSENKPEKSRVTWISSKNIGGVTSPKGDDIFIEFPSLGSFVACTGETGSGKSLLLAKAAELLSGGKASPRILGLDVASNRTEVTAEVEFFLNEPHLSMVQQVLNMNGFVSISLKSSEQMLRCKRRVVLLKPKETGPKNYRLRSICEINGQPVTIGLLSSIVSRLLAVVDGTNAASELARPLVRTSILDATIPERVLLDYEEKKRTYRKVKKELEKLEASINNRALPKGYYLNNEDENDSKLLSHWVGELDAFENRVIQFCKSLGGLGPDGQKSRILRTCSKIATSNWMEDVSSNPRFFASSIHMLLGELRDNINSLDGQILAATNAANALTMLSSKQSVLTALEQSRRFVDEASGRNRESGAILDAAERVHDLLNDIEEATKRCAQYLEDDRAGLLQVLQTERVLCPLSVSQIDDILLQWGTLARKHGVSPASLPSCHEALITEQNGKNEALEILPQLVAKEQNLRTEFVEASRTLSEFRHEAAKRLSLSVNERLPSLGMKAIFEARVDSSRLDHVDQLVSLGPDDVDFLISQRSTTSSPADSSLSQIHLVASSGEKARILLAIECAIPGSVAAACMKSTPSEEAVEFSSKHRPLLPVLVLYDEIDAHVSGNAATAIGAMLSEQSNSKQILAITHSPAVAALADHHIVVQKLNNNNSSNAGEKGRFTLVDVKRLSQSDRTRELARMASGNVAVPEAEAFAEALLRNGKIVRNNMLPS